MNNDRNDEFEANVYAQITHDGKKQEEATFFGPRPFLGAAVTTPSDRYMKLSFDDIAEEQFRESNNGGWIALLQHYFLSAWVTNDDASYLYYGMRNSSGKYRFGLTGPAQTIPAHQSGEFALRFYVGPKTLTRLDEIAENLNLTVDYGFLWWLSMPLFYLLYWLHELVGNWGFIDHLVDSRDKGDPVSVIEYEPASDGPHAYVVTTVETGPGAIRR